ncbi:hypothetical protein [Paenibacillus alvei]|uniref:Uncharacterized protein n=1 Tax=Paenibacillus alvei TaxID=44250 RepID=A0AAP6ZXC5_PAEAL|nr:hypothetical protein [Paenibacillus alvei]NOJ69807.1 hypothetical protein [Paenibacillus alvei]
MNLKKAIVATLVVSSMLTTLAGPIPAGAKAQEQKQSDYRTIQIDPKLAEKLNQALKLFAGKDVELQKVGKRGLIYKKGLAEVRSVDGKYYVQFDGVKDKESILYVGGQTATIDQISKQHQEEVLKWLKVIDAKYAKYAKKQYAFEQEVWVSKRNVRAYAPLDRVKLSKEKRYELKGKDFSTFSIDFDDGQLKTYYLRIDFDKKELDPKLLSTVIDAAKTAFQHKFEMTSAQLAVNVFPITAHGKNKAEAAWVFHDGKVTVYVDPNTGEIKGMYKEFGIRVRDHKGISEKEAKEAVAPLAKKLFNIDMNGYSVKWDEHSEDYYFTSKNGMNVRAALDANKKIVYIRAGKAAVNPFDGYVADMEVKSK